MVQAAKVVIVDEQDNYLMLTRANHPRFGNDPDIPGGLVEPGELPLDAAIREVQEEIGVVLTPNQLREVFVGTQYSTHGIEDTLFIAQIPRPRIRLSWEHADYTWHNRALFTELAAGANDAFMHMVADVLKGVPRLARAAA